MIKTISKQDIFKKYLDNSFIIADGSQQFNEILLKLKELTDGKLLSMTHEWALYNVPQHENLHKESKFSEMDFTSYKQSPVTQMDLEDGEVTYLVSYDSFDDTANGKLNLENVVAYKIEENAIYIVEYYNPTPGSIIINKFFSE